MVMTSFCRSGRNAETATIRSHYVNIAEGLVKAGTRAISAYLEFALTVFAEIAGFLLSGYGIAGRLQKM